MKPALPAGTYSVVAIEAVYFPPIKPMKLGDREAGLDALQAAIDCQPPSPCRDTKGQGARALRSEPGSRRSSLAKESSAREARSRLFQKLSRRSQFKDVRRFPVRPRHRFWDRGT